MRRIAIGCMALWLVWWLTGCAWRPIGGYAGEEPDTQRYRTELTDAWCYRQTEGGIKANYERLYAAVRAHEVTDDGITAGVDDGGNYRWALTVSLDPPLASADDVERVYRAVTTDHPQFFFLDNHYRVSSEIYRGTERYVGLTCYFLWDAADRAEAIRWLDRAVEQVVGSAGAVTEEFERERLLHDRLAALCTYETRAEKAEDPAYAYPCAFTAYGALVEGRAVCEGYARAFQLLAHRAGLACTLVDGTDTAGRAHRWNMIVVDGSVYQVDVTWDDAEDRGVHTYFNLTADEMEKSRRIDPSSAEALCCTAREGNYFRHTGRWLTSADSREIARAVAEQVRVGAFPVELRFAEEVFPLARERIDRCEALTREVNALLADDGQRRWEYRRYTADERYGTVALYTEG